MGVRIIHGAREAALYCSTSDWAFGPVFSDSDNYDAAERAESFLRFLGARDARQFTEKALEDLYSQWLGQEDEQWEKEESNVE
jgi:hypothetical protein